ncbi:hypothetical protein HPB51_026928 [Rhipicephalus microplus]|uniref:Tick transposon n=1 Tax=Rhipicephalus microplus TaxID=6941 RepID=A0A9J6D1W2_RHIMP|nr:hypothetical protein HPB51_026928 [Rhipicephalus microplus]
MNQLAQLQVLLNHISTTTGPFFNVSSVPSSSTFNLLVSHIVTTTCRSRYLSFCLRKGLVPAEVLGLFGFALPTPGHANRVCRLIRSELWRQTRLLQDYLRVLCYASDPPWKAEVELRSLRAYTARMVEFWWASYLSSVLHVIRKKADKRRGESPVLVLGDDVEIPEHVERILKKGPKFSYEPVVPPQELLAFNRRVATRAPQDQYVRCLLEGVDALSRTCA